MFDIALYMRHKRMPNIKKNPRDGNLELWGIFNLILFQNYFLWKIPWTKEKKIKKDMIQHYYNDDVWSFECKFSHFDRYFNGTKKDEKKFDSSQRRQCVWIRGNVGVEESHAYIKLPYLR